MAATRLSGRDMVGDNGTLTEAPDLLDGLRAAKVSKTPDHVRGARPSLETVWAWLSDIPDPEIPVISLTDLGIIRDVAWDADMLVVTVTPTYSGCPATSIINLDIENALRDRGIENLTLKRQLSPPWTTDWLTDEGRAKLERYGIAPPHPGKGPQHCPRCKSTHLEKISQFGSTPCKAQWRCQSCLEPFDFFKCI